MMKVLGETVWDDERTWLDFLKFMKLLHETVWDDEGTW